jgi:hypothetical protein
MISLMIEEREKEKRLDRHRGGFKSSEEIKRTMSIAW